MLRSYWGYLSDGGLVVEKHDLREGQPVMLDLLIEQSHAAQSVSGRVVGRDPGRDSAIVALDPGESGRLLKVALADAEVDVDAELSDPGSGHAHVRLLNISDTGCCVRVADAEAFPVGSEVEMTGPGFTATGCVVWALENDRGVMFADDDPQATDAVRRYLASVR